jgi:hypothetical protein
MGSATAGQAATQAVPGGAAGEVDQETDEGGVVYGVTVTRPDRTAAEVHLDKDFHVADLSRPVITKTPTETTIDGPVEG